MSHSILIVVRRILLFAGIAVAEGMIIAVAWMPSRPTPDVEAHANPAFLAAFALLVGIIAIGFLPALRWAPTPMRHLEALAKASILPATPGVGMIVAVFGLLLGALDQNLPVVAGSAAIWIASAIACWIAVARHERGSAPSTASMPTADYAAADPLRTRYLVERILREGWTVVGPGSGIDPLASDVRRHVRAGVLAVGRDRVRLDDLPEPWILTVLATVSGSDDASVTEPTT